MLESYNEFIAWLKGYHGAYEVYAITVVLVVAWLINAVVKLVLKRVIAPLLNATIWRKSEIFKKTNIIDRLANLVPAIIIYRGITQIGIHDMIIWVIQLACAAFIILTVGRVFSCVLDIINALWQKRPDAASRPIKGYLQVIKIVIYSVCALMIIARFVNEPVIYILSGLGAMAAVLMLVFQDTLLSLVASIQITSNNTIRIGDWIEMPQADADGDVIDIALHTISVQNWDKTVTTIPTKKFMTDSFKNWRGMEEAGGRRIKRSIYIDQNSIHFLSADEEEKFKRFYLLHDYIVQKQKETADWNKRLHANHRSELNHRRITNIGTFRVYVEQYLKHNPYIHQGLTLLVRQLAPTAEGLPLELYCFTNDIRWGAYEGIQSDIFDHMLAILPEFGLQVFQDPSGKDMRGLAEFTPRDQARERQQEESSYTPPQGD